MTVTFFLPGEPDLDALERLDPERSPGAFLQGQRVWVLQTYLNLKAAGRPVILSGSVPSEGAVVFYAGHKRQLREGLPRRHGLLVGVRGDRREPLMADAEVVQNSHYADGRNRFYIPHWPQPGLIPRDPVRGDRLDRAAFKGHLENMHPAFRGAEWRDFLNRQGIAWEVDAVESQRISLDGAALKWHDCSAVDLLVGVRPLDARLHRSKPASKLINAWTAGVPAILGPEAALRALRRSELDYFECATPEEAQACVRRLQDEPGLYRAMVENGIERSREFTREAVVHQWEELLFSRLETLARRPWVRFHRLLRPRLKITVKWCLRALAMRPAK